MSSHRPAADPLPDPTASSPPAASDPIPGAIDRALEMTRALIDALEGTSVSRLVVCAGAIRIEVESYEPPTLVAPVSEQLRVITAAQNGDEATVSSAQPVADISPLAEVRAPLVGVFYRRADPGKPPMVGVGDRVEAGHPLAIVEAMKMMNEVVAGVAGTIVGIHAEDQDVVEFDELLFTIQAGAPDV